MKINTDNTIVIIDRMILGFILLFAATLNNSIFINQIGYFGALLLVAFKYFKTKENPFQKTGLELPFVLYLASLLLSAIFSLDPGFAFTELIKTLLLIPIIYVVIISAGKEQNEQLIFKTYLYAALITVIVYLFFSYQHFLNHLYRSEAKGPSPFQYVMTAGGLMTFTSVFFFSLLINEKVKLPVKLFYLIAFGLTSISVVASFTRAAWLGLFVGIIVILIAKRKWTLLASGFILIFLFLSLNSSKSFVNHYKLKNNSLILVQSIQTQGRASGIEVLARDTVLIADYNKGLLVSTNGKVVQNISVPSPATQIFNWSDNRYICYTFDSRMLLLEKGINNNFTIADTFYSPGMTKDLKVSNGKLFIADEDSGLTVYINPFNIKETIKDKNHIGITNVNPLANYFVGYYNSPLQLKLFSAKDGFPYKVIDSLKNTVPFMLVWPFKDIVIFQGNDGLEQYSITENRFKSLRKDKIAGVVKVKFADSTAYALTADGKLYNAKYNPMNGFQFKLLKNLAMPSYDFGIGDSSIYVASFKKNRLASIIDPYHETNFERLQIWNVGLKMFLANPLVGVGDIDLNDSFRLYKEKYYKNIQGHMHNNVVHWLATLGIIGLATIVFMFFVIFKISFKIYSQVKSEPLISSYSLGVLASLFAFIFSGLGEYNFGDQEIITVIWFILGLNFAFYYQYKNKEKHVDVN